MVKKKEQAKISNGAVGTEMVVNGWVREVKCIMSVTGPMIEHIEYLPDERRRRVLCESDCCE